MENKDPIIQEEIKENKDENTDLLNELKDIIKKQADLIAKQTKEIEKQKILSEIKEVPAVKEDIPIQEVFEVMTPADHVEKIFKDVERRFTVYKNPGKLTDIEAAT